jgi:hypothetical protein
MNYPTPLPESEKGLIDRIFEVVESTDSNTKWVAGITLLADVLLRQDKRTVARTLAGLTAEIRAALERIPEIQRNGVSPDAPGSLQ